MRRGTLIGLGIVVVLAVGLGLGYGQRLALYATLLMAHPPSQPFDAANVPPAPDYSAQASWGALPDKKDASDVAPPEISVADPASAPADIFFIHPTTFFSNSEWNQPLSDEGTNARTDSGPLRFQASVFNGCCRVFAPRYRQATFGAFLKHSKSSDEALTLAYSDIRRAFDYYIAHYNRGRPFIIASHSQGSRLAVMLLPDAIDGTPLRRQFVAAYIVGKWITEDWFTNLKTIKPCERTDDTGCVLTWSTLAEGADAQAQRLNYARRSGMPDSFADKRFVCTNPLTWTRSTAIAPADGNLGAWVPGRDATFRRIVPGLVSARCDDGALFVSDPGDEDFKAALLPGGNYHNYDYQLFYMNIRKNAGERVRAFLAEKHG